MSTSPHHRTRSAGCLPAAAALLALVAPAGATPDVTLQRVLARGMEVPKLGRLADTSVDDAACLGPNGVAVTATRTDDGARGLVCIDADGPRVIVRAADPALESGVFERFLDCKIDGRGNVVFAAYRRYRAEDAAGEFALYRIGPAGIESLVTLEDTGYNDWAYTFAVNEHGDVVVTVPGRSDLWLLPEGGLLQHVALEGPPGAGWTSVAVHEVALTNSGVVVLGGQRNDGRATVLAWRDGQLRVLAEAGDLSPAGAPYDHFVLFAAYGDIVLFSGLSYDGRTEGPPPSLGERFGAYIRHHLRFDARRNAGMRIIATDDPFPIIQPLRREIEERTGDDTVLLGVNQRGNFLLSVEDPGPLDILLAGPESEGVCPPNDALSETVPHLPTPSPTATPRPTPTRGPVNPIDLEVQTDAGQPGQTVPLRVLLHTHGNPVAGVEMEISASAPIRIARSSAGSPACRGNPNTGKDFTRFALRDDQLKAVIISLTNVAPIPDGIVLFACDVDIAVDAAPGTYRLGLTDLQGSTPAGDPIDARALGGEVIVIDPPTHAQQPGAPGGSAGGCQAGAANPRASAMLLLGAALLLGVRTRRRSTSAAGVPGALARSSLTPSDPPRA